MFLDAPNGIEDGNSEVDVGEAGIGPARNESLTFEDAVSGHEQPKIKNIQHVTHHKKERVFSND